MLTFDGVVAGYGGRDVLRGVQLDVREGSITCVVGPNGAGKSTLLKVVSGLLRPSAGTVTFRGRVINRASPAEILKAGIVQVLQARGLFAGMTVRENLELGAFLIRDKASVKARLDEVLQDFPMVAQRAGDRAGELSGGQQRMVELARALMLDPALVVLDEPSTGLEPRAARGMYDVIRRLNAAGRTILLVEQNVRAGLQLSTHGVVMEGGRVRLEGSGQAVLENPEMRALYFGGTLEEAPGADTEDPGPSGAQAGSLTSDGKR